MTLRPLLSALVFGSASTACGSVLPSSCPHEVVDQRADVDVSDDDACLLANRSLGFRLGRDIATCQKLCNDSRVTSCSLPNAYLDTISPGVDGGPAICPKASSAIKLTCVVAHTEGTSTSGCPVEGRLTEGLRPTSAITSLATFFAHCAELEAISVQSFGRLARELRAIGAPESFALRAERAALEEIGHARAMSMLAARFGAEVPNVITPNLPLRSAFAIALENAVEGAVRETFGAAVALHQAHHARDAAVRAVHLRIAEDERTHAELALDLAAYFRTVLSADACDAIELAQRAAIAELRHENTGPLSPALAAAGLPQPNDALRIVDGLDAALWTGRLAA